MVVEWGRIYAPSFTAGPHYSRSKTEYRSILKHKQQLEREFRKINNTTYTARTQTLERIGAGAVPYNVINTINSPRGRTILHIMLEKEGFSGIFRVFQHIYHHRSGIMNFVALCVMRIGGASSVDASSASTGGINNTTNTTNTVFAGISNTQIVRMLGVDYSVWYIKQTIKRMIYWQRTQLSFVYAWDMSRRETKDSQPLATLPIDIMRIIAGHFINVRSQPYSVKELLSAFGPRTTRTFVPSDQTRTDRKRSADAVDVDDDATDAADAVDDASTTDTPPPRKEKRRRKK